MLSGNTVKYIQSLTHKKFREQYGCFIAETPKVVHEFLTAGYDSAAIYATEAWMRSRPFTGSVDPGSITVVRDYELNKISQLKTPREVVAVFRIPEAPLPAIENKITLALDDIQDPGNVGTIIRIADWFGVENILCSLHTANAYNPKVVQATMGSLAHVTMHYTDLAAVLSEAPVPVYVASLEGSSVFKTEKITAGILVIGNEGKGVSENIAALAAQHLTIPRLGHAESLNAAMAAGIILSHLVSA